MATPLRSRGPASVDEVTVGRDRVVFRVTSEQTGGELAVFDVTIPPGGGPPMLHRHDPFELYRVRSGELAFYLEGSRGSVTRSVAGPGAFVPISGGVEHTIRNESAEDAHATVVFAPGEAMERFARAAAAGGAPAEVLALAEAHGIEVTRSIEDALAETNGDAPGSGEGYLTIARFAGDGEQLLDDYLRYQDAMSAVGRDHDLILHAGAKTDSGFLVVNLWPSKEHSEAAARDPRRLDVVARAELAPEQVDREHHEPAHFTLFG